MGGEGALLLLVPSAAAAAIANRERASEQSMAWRGWLSMAIGELGNWAGKAFLGRTRCRSRDPGPRPARVHIRRHLCADTEFLCLPARRPARHPNRDARRGCFRALLTLRRMAVPLRGHYGRGPPLHYGLLCESSTQRRPS